MAALSRRVSLASTFDCRFFHLATSSQNSAVLSPPGRDGSLLHARQPPQTHPSAHYAHAVGPRGPGHPGGEAAPEQTTPMEPGTPPLHHQTRPRDPALQRTLRNRRRARPVQSTPNLRGRLLGPRLSNTRSMSPRGLYPQSSCAGSRDIPVMSYKRAPPLRGETPRPSKHSFQAAATQRATYPSRVPRRGQRGHCFCRVPHDARKSLPDRRRTGRASPRGRTSQGRTLTGRPSAGSPSEPPRPHPRTCLHRR